MKKPLLYYFSLILIIVLAQISSAFIVKYIKTQFIYLELISRLIFLFFLSIQYFLYIKFNKLEDDKFEVKYESTSYVYLEQKNIFLKDFFQGKNPVPFNIGLFSIFIFFFYLLAIAGSNLQFLLLKIFRNSSIFVDTGIFYFKAIQRLMNENLFLSFLLIVFIGPVMEEIVFRGFSLSLKFQDTKRLIITIFMSILFTIMHFDFSRLFPLFAMGFALGLIYNVTQSLIYPIGIHIINNGISFLILILAKNFDKTYLEDKLFGKYSIFTQNGNFKSLWIIVITIVLLGCAIITTYKKINNIIEEKYNKI